MREILFRGKRLNDGEWVDGDLRHGGYFLDDNTIYIVANGYINCPVDPTTVGQYTGLTDKNGKRIFEGDVVSTDIARPYLVVEFRDGCFMFNCNDGGKDYYDIMLPILEEAQTVYKYGEVIGTIHDNPELLKEENT